MEGYIAEIRMFAADFAPKYWAFCQGQTWPIAQNQALFSLLGTTFGGNGQTTFNLPDFRSRVAVGTGQGTATPYITQGQMAGTPYLSLIQSNLPPHTHPVIGATSVPVTGTIKATVNVNNTESTVSSPAGNYLGTEGGGNGLYASAAGSGQTLNSAAIQVGGSTLGVNTASISVGISGASAPISLGMPSLGMNFVICTQGIFPSRN